MSMTVHQESVRVLATTGTRSAPLHLFLFSPSCHSLSFKASQGFTDGGIAVGEHSPCLWIFPPSTDSQKNYHEQVWFPRWHPCAHPSLSSNFIPSEPRNLLEETYFIFISTVVHIYPLTFKCEVHSYNVFISWIYQVETIENGSKCYSIAHN